MTYTTQSARPAIVGAIAAPAAAHTYSGTKRTRKPAGSALGFDWADADNHLDNSARSPFLAQSRRWTVVDNPDCSFLRSACRHVQPATIRGGRCCPGRFLNKSLTIAPYQSLTSPEIVAGRGNRFE